MTGACFSYVKGLTARLCSRASHVGAISEFTQWRRRRLRKRHLKGEFVLTQTLSRLFHLVWFVKFWQIFVELILKGSIKVPEKKKKVVVFCPRPATKREIRQFHVVVVQRRQRNVSKNVMHVQSCCFACLNLLLFCRSRCRRRRRCINSLFVIGGGCPKWKPLVTGGTRPTTSEAVANSIKELFLLKSTRSRRDQIFQFPFWGCQVRIVLVWVHFNSMRDVIGRF